MGLRNEDPRDLARRAIATASGSSRGSAPQNLLSGQTYNTKDDTRDR